MKAVSYTHLALVLLGIRLSQAQQHPFALDLKGFFEAWGHFVPRILLAPVGKLSLIHIWTAPAPSA